MSKNAHGAGAGITLPKGGGALQGIGETFSPDLYTGTGNFTIPIALPPGRNGLQPQLSLAYSTGSGNSPFGLGWSLSLPAVSRKTSKGVPRYDTRDVFLLAGAEDLVPVAETALAVRYRPRTEGMFARIVRHRNTDTDHWEVQSKDGLTSIYGTPGTAGADPAAVADPHNPTHVFAWKLSRTTDLYGNCIEYRYERDTTRTDGPHVWDQLYLSEIRYVNYGDRNAPMFLVSVRFLYEQRPDPFSEYRAGFEIRTTRRCLRIDVRTHTSADHLVRSYTLSYLDQHPDKAHTLPPNNASLLHRVTVAGNDGTTDEKLPPLDFIYSRFEPSRRQLKNIGGSYLPVAPLAQPGCELVDLFGRGLPDILEVNGTVRYWRNLGEGRFDRPHIMDSAPAGLSLNDPNTRLLDANGDGRPDLMSSAHGLSGYYPLSFNGAWDKRSFQRYTHAPSFNLNDPEVRLLDLDGNGTTDALRTGSRFECFFSHPTEGWHETRLVERRALANFPNVTFSDSRVRLADMSGDGLQDIVLVNGRVVSYWPNLGHGNWGRRIIMRQSPDLPTNYDLKRLLLGDIDGDGLADLVYVDHGRVTFWINQGGNGWSKPFSIAGTPPVADGDSLRLVDLFGTGVSGLLWGGVTLGGRQTGAAFLDFVGGHKPYLLCEMNANSGTLTRLQYATSTHYYLEDQKRAETRWSTPLPFPVQVIARVEVIDAVSGGRRVTEYSYHHGYWDGHEREFRGFGRVDQRDAEMFEGHQAEDPYVPPTETRTWFHQGPVSDGSGDWTEPDYSREYWTGDPNVLTRPHAMAELLRGLPRATRRNALRTLKGRTLRTELYALDASERAHRPYAVTESLYGVRAEMMPQKGEQPIFFAMLFAQRTSQWERGDDPMTSFSFGGEYDAYGNSLGQITVAVPRDRDYTKGIAPGQPAESYLATLTRTTYALRDDERFIADRVARTTRYEVQNDGRLDIHAFVAAIQSNGLTLRPIGQTRRFYDGAAFTGLALGEIGDFGALSRSETLVFTEPMLQQAYGELIPPYLLQRDPQWTDEYPNPFREQMPALAGYTFYQGGSTPDDIAGYFATAEQRGYDWQLQHNSTSYGLVQATRNPLGHETRIGYDRFALLPAEVTDAAGLTTSVVYDERVLQPELVVEPNGNQTAYTYTPLGLLASIVVMGKPGEAVGDTLEQPTARFEYDFLAFSERRQPISVRTSKRVWHASDTSISETERDAVVETVEFSDGFGRLIQRRVLAEDTRFGDAHSGADVLSPDQNSQNLPIIGHTRSTHAPDNVVVSGWQVYDSKGRVIEQYEPFFSTGWGFAAPREAERGQKTCFFYDPRGQVIRTVFPNGAEQRVIRGVPGSRASPELTNPTEYEPSPWETYTYDTNDNAGRTHPEQATAYQHHWNTPSSAAVDALGRTVLTIDRNGSDAAGGWHTTRFAYDIAGTLLSVTDTLGRATFAYSYDLTQRQLRITQLDAGTTQVVFDAAGNTIERRDAKGSLVLQSYDSQNRVERIWARDGEDQPLTLRERRIYGDSARPGLTRKQAAASNLLGRIVQYYDEAGRLTVTAYDFKGNILEQSRQVISDSAQLLAISWSRTPPPAVDWQPADGLDLDQHAQLLLDSTTYQTSFTYDALNHIVAMRYPQDVSGARKQLRQRRNRAGALEQVSLDGAAYVTHIAYDARGRRSLIAYGNGIMTRSCYDERTGRLARIRSERYTQHYTLTFQPHGEPFQDTSYTYDLIGNVLSMHERVPGCGLPANPKQLDRVFGYDPLYQLTAASGRETDVPDVAPWDDTPRSADMTRVRAYHQRYQYDAVGNMVQMRHHTADTQTVREYALAPQCNRLQSLTIGEATYAYQYDAVGNLVQETSSRHFAWDYRDRLRSFHIRAGNAEPSVYALYLYDTSGQRVKKLTRKQGGQIEVTIYIGGVFEHHRTTKGDVARENNSLHVMDEQQRLAILRVGELFDGDTNPRLQYHLADHLGSSTIVVDGSGEWVRREEYTPFGESSFGGYALKRYRFTGKQRDEESGLYYHGARYYAPWLSRWASCDPLGGPNNPYPYAYVRNRPLNHHDPSGMIEQPASGSGQADNTKPPISPEMQSHAAAFRQNPFSLQGLKHLVHGLASWGEKDTTPPEQRGQKIVRNMSLALGYSAGFGMNTVKGTADGNLTFETVWSEKGQNGLALAGQGLSLASKYRTLSSFVKSTEQLKPQMLGATVEVAASNGAELDGAQRMTRMVNQLRKEGVPIRGKFVHVEPGHTQYDDVVQHGGAFHSLAGPDKGTTYVNMAVLETKGVQGSGGLTAKQILQHEMGHFGQQAKLPSAPDGGANWPAYFRREAEASFEAGLNAKHAADANALFKHAERYYDYVRSVCAQ